MSFVNANICSLSVAYACLNSLLLIAKNVVRLLTFIAIIVGVFWVYFNLFYKVNNKCIKMS